MNPKEFRKELLKIMPGYNWTVHQSSCPETYLSATGIQSSGFNRLSTLKVERREEDNGVILYEVKSSGYGVRTPWLSTAVDRTLARALRSLQSYYENMANTYSNHAQSLKNARHIVQ